MYRINKIIHKNIQTIALLLGAFIFLLLYGYKIIDPSEINWIMAGGDPSQHFLGWHFFRSETWHFPFGVIEKYHYPSGTCLTFMDAIPLIGIPLKIFNNFLPQPFQYTGLWLMLVYMLQGFFAALLLKKFTNDWRLILLGATFFILSPIMFFRAGAHEALAGHWLILAALYLYLFPATVNTGVKWTILIVMSSMIHFYLLVMVLAIWAGYLLKVLFKGFNKRDIIIYVLLTILILLFVMWFTGYFIIPISDAKSEGFGHYSMNLLAPFNPAGGGETTFLNKMQFAVSGQYEGYNYFGMGVLILMVLSLFKIPQALKDSEQKTLLPIVIVMLLFFIYSLSSKVTYGSEILFEFQYPWHLKDLGDMLRASGRMFWPVYYALIYTALIIILKYYKSKIAVIFLSFALLVQIIDFYPWYNNRNLGSGIFETTLRSDKWKIIANSVKHIIMIPPKAESDPKNNFALFASNNLLDINIGRVARENIQKRSKYYQKIMKEFNSNILQEETLYIVNKNNLIIPSKKNKEKYFFAILDDYYIIIPKNSKLKLVDWLPENSDTIE